MKERKIAFILLGMTVVLVTTILIGYVRMRSSQKISTTLPNIQISPTPEELATWENQAQFSFQYPKSLELDPHEEDQENYAHVELTSDKYPGNLVVWVKDSDAEAIDDWVEDTKQKGVIDSLLGGEKAVKVLSTTQPKKLITTTIHDGYLYQIEATVLDDYWSNIFNTVSSSFKFRGDDKKDKDDNSSWDDSDIDDAVYEEEEVIE